MPEPKTERRLRCPLGSRAQPRSFFFLDQRSIFGENEGGDCKVVI